MAWRAEPVTKASIVYFLINFDNISRSNADNSPKKWDAKRYLYSKLGYKISDFFWDIMQEEMKASRKNCSISLHEISFPGVHFNEIRKERSHDGASSIIIEHLQIVTYNSQYPIFI